MKLLFCSSCNDVFAIHKQERSCLCGKTKGRYLDNLNATYSGTGAVPLGFHNQSFMNSVMGKEFVAFVIPHLAPNFKEEKPALPENLADTIAKKLSRKEKLESFSEFVRLKEMIGSVGSIVSCDDLDNPNFQVQGSLSNLKCKKRKKK